MWEEETGMDDDAYLEMLSRMTSQLAVELKTKNAEEGDLSAIKELAMNYYFGIDGFAKNLEKAKYYAQIAMQSGSDVGEFIYGLVLFDTMDREGGISHIKKAADLGYDLALFAMGELYREGYLKGFFSKKKMANYYRAAAERALHYGQYMLAYCYYYGDGVRQDIEQFEFWLCCAYINELPAAGKQISIELQNGHFGGVKGFEKSRPNMGTISAIYFFLD